MLKQLPQPCAGNSIRSPILPRAPYYPASSIIVEMTLPSSPPIYFGKIESPGSSYLLMHKVEMFALLQPLIRLATFEARSQPVCTLFQSLQRVT